MDWTRRQFGMLGLAMLSSARGLDGSLRSAASAQGRGSSQEFGGVEVGAISYCFRQISYNPEDVLKAMTSLGLRSIELEQSFFEMHFGAPRDPTGGGQPQGVGTVRAGAPFPDKPLVAMPARGQGQGAGAGAARGGGRGGPSPEEEAQRAAVRADLKKWRLAAPWDKVRALRKLYNDAGVEIRLVKFPQLGGTEMSDEEVDYCFQMAKTMGARGLTCEPPLSQSKRVARFADKHQMVVAYHNHSNVTSVEAFARPGSWEQAFFYSKYNWANVDIGHFTAGNSRPPTDFIREYHARITNIHLKDRRINNGPNVPWGEGDTPIKETLQLMKQARYSFMAAIELEYPIPEGSSVMDEMRKCVQYCKDALG